jgi:surface polysaccharide O-acyltransferase-like enzyme
MTWLDANRVTAAIGVVLIHSTSDASGQLYPNAQPAERAVPLIFRWLSEFSGSEVFFVFSLFLLAFRLHRKPVSYGQTVSSQAARLLIPFAAWTVFYAFFRLFKASIFGYAPAVLHEVSQGSSWVDYLLLGTAQYHLHFMPTLFALVLMYPVFMAAFRYPAAGLLVVPLLFVLDAVQGAVWGHFYNSPTLRDYLLRLVKIVTYGGYGLAAFSLFSIFRKGMSDIDLRLIGRLAMAGIVVAFMTMLPGAYDQIMTGQSGVRSAVANYGHFLMPLFIFTAFMASQNAKWSPRFSVAAQYTYGVYLVHPIFIDLWDGAVKYYGLQMDDTTQMFIKFAIGTAGGFGLTYALSKIRLLGWMVGLGPLPFTSPAAPRPAARPEGKTATA